MEVASTSEARLRRWTMHHMCTHDASHDIHHVDAVVHLAKMITCEWEDPVLRDAVVVTAMAHEVCDRKYTHRPEDALDMLDEAIATHTHYDERVRRLALRVVPTISFSKRLAHGVPEFSDDDERRVYLAVSDADYLESLGAIGVVRTCVYQSIHARGLLSKPRGDIDHAIDYMLTRLVLTYDHLHFAASKAEGAIRLRRLRRVCAELRRERAVSTLGLEVRGARGARGRFWCDVVLATVFAWQVGLWCLAMWNDHHDPVDGNSTPTSPHCRLR